MYQTPWTNSRDRNKYFIMSVPYIFFHKDLDGVVSYLILCWVYGQRLPYCDVPNAKHLKALLDKNLKSIYGHYTPIVFADLDTRDVNTQLEKLEDILVFDHHASNTNDSTQSDASSCSKLIYQWAKKEKNLTLSPERKALVALADDYDSWAHKTPTSKHLNIVYHGTADKVESFVDCFWDGFNGFDDDQEKIIKRYENGLFSTLNQLQLFQANFSIQGKQRNLVTTFCEDYVEECMEKALEETGADIVFGVHRNASRVFIRKSKSCDADLSKLAIALLGGGGHEDAAGGVITETFLTFSKIFE